VRTTNRTRAAGRRLLLLIAASAALVAACGQGATASPGRTTATTPNATAVPTEVATPSPATSQAASQTTGGGIPPLLASIAGFDVSPIEPTAIDGFTAAAGASLGANGTLGDAVGARATRADDDPVDLIAFTVLPATGVTENDTLFLIMDGIAEGTGGDWKANAAIGWFALDHDSGRALMIPWGNVPDGTVFLLVVGADDAPVDDVANAILEAG
jgi:hypothetical protein